MKKTLNLVYIALAAVLITLCSWIQIPTVVPFTMQTFAIFCVLSLLGGRRGTAAILLYLILGTAGLPVFAQFTSGPGILLGTTGGYLTGFLFLGLFSWVPSPGAYFPSYFPIWRRWLWRFWPRAALPPVMSWMAPCKNLLPGFPVIDRPFPSFYTEEKSGKGGIL